MVEGERARLGVTPQAKDVSTTQHTHLATLAREEGMQALAAIHERIASAAHDERLARAAMAIYKGKSKAAVAQRADAMRQAIAAIARLKSAQDDLAAAGG